MSNNVEPYETAHDEPSYPDLCCSIYFFLNSANLISRGTDISKYFRESLGIRDLEP